METPSKAGQTRGLTNTGPVGGQFEAWRALAAVAAWDVDTVGIALAQVVPTVTLINICTTGEKERTSFMGSITV